VRGSINSSSHRATEPSARSRFALSDAGNNALPSSDKRVQMSSTAVNRDRTDRVEVRDRAVVEETKIAFKTTEFLAYLATIAGVLVAAAVDDTIDARLAWILVTALGIGYMLSRGFAKSGSINRDYGDRT
jgi:hypothetical protein